MSKRTKRNAAGQYFCGWCLEYSDRPMTTGPLEGKQVVCCETCAAQLVKGAAEDEAYEAWINSGLAAIDAKYAAEEAAELERQAREEAADLAEIAAMEAEWEAEDEAAWREEQAYQAGIEADAAA